MAYGMINKPEHIPLQEDKILWRDKQRPFFGLPLSFTKYILFSDRLIIERCLLSYRQEELRLYRVRDITLRQTIFQRLFRVGTLYLDTLDISSPRIILQDILDPVSVMKILSNVAEWERQRYGVRYVEGLGDLSY